MYPITDATYSETALRRVTGAPAPRPAPVTVGPKDLDAIYTYWFGCEGRAEHLEESRILFWMQANEETDAEIRSRFGHLLPVAAGMTWNVRTLTTRQRMGLLVLLDQFPRNLFRSSGEAYAYDEMARSVAGQIAADCEALTIAEGFILGLPLVHHEDLSSQDRAVMIAAKAAVEATNDSDRQAMRRALDQAIRHRDVIQKFGRFPHRNAQLGRQSTPEENAFMAANGRGF